MRHANPLAGTAFRSALLFLLVFVLVLPVTGAAILKWARDSMEDELRSSISDDIGLVHDAEMTGGERELARFVDASARTRPDDQFAIGLFELDGTAIAGNVPETPAFSDWGTLPLPAAQAPDGPFLGYAERLDDRIIVIGRSEQSIQAVSEDIFNALLIAGLVICVCALVIGLLLSRSVSNKLDVIDRTLDRVSRGDTDVRLPVGASNDQIDQVSRKINAHLDRLSEFLAGMRLTIAAIAHDLKSPLNRAFIALQAAADECEPGTAAAAIERAEAEVERLDGILETVLRISRIESSDDTSSFLVFAPAELMEDLAQTFQPVVDASGQTLAFSNAGAADVLVSGDRKMIAQMLVNLIENAIRHSGPGSRIVLALEGGPSGTVMTVSDSGPGIPAGLREEVFRPFRRLKVERNFPGSGLGLALVKAIAVRHHARITLGDNEPGLLVTIAFPSVRTAAVQQSTAPAAESGVLRAA